MAVRKKPKKHEEQHGGFGSQLRDIILGGQDGLVNVLGILLAVASATNDRRVVIIAGLAATLAESISMAAVAYTSTKAEYAFYESERRREEWEVRNWPQREREEIREIYHAKGFRGTLLNRVVQKITSNKKVWIDTMMVEELKLFPKEDGHPVWSAFVVGVSAVVGSLIPLAPFFFIGVTPSIWISLIISIAALFITGAIKAKITVGSWWKSGVEMMIVGTFAALIGYGIGLLLGAAPIP